MKKREASILIVDDDAAVLTSAKLFLKQKFTFVHTLNEPSNLTKALKELEIEIVLLDMNYTKGENDGYEGLRLIKKIQEEFPTVEVIPITAYSEVDLAVEAMKNGARDFVTKPWQNAKLESTINNILDLNSVKKELDELKKANSEVEPIPNFELIGNSNAFQNILNLARKAAPTEANILITGENGTGKELMARFIHQHSERNHQTLVTVDLGAIPSSLFESELFGHRKGSFTDAKSDRNGKFSVANGGTLFLDEIGNIAPHLQSKLLSAIQKKQILPIGSSIAEDIDVRLICATNADLDTMIVDNQFRQDLMYRINTVEIRIPPLRERKSDIPLIAEYYLNIFRSTYKKPGLKLSKEIEVHLNSYEWPGNIRELKHVVERAAILSEDGILNVSDFPLKTGENEASGNKNLNLQEMEKTLILKSLQKNKGNITRAAKDLGIDRLALYRRLEKYGL